MHTEMACLDFKVVSKLHRSNAWPHVGYSIRTACHVRSRFGFSYHDTRTLRRPQGSEGHFDTTHNSYFALTNHFQMFCGDFIFCEVSSFRVYSTFIQKVKKAVQIRCGYTPNQRKIDVTAAKVSVLLFFLESGRAGRSHPERYHESLTIFSETCVIFNLLNVFIN